MRTRLLILIPLLVLALAPIARAAPTVILLPGGGWETAYPATMQPWVDDFRAHGIRAFAISYPLRDVPGAIRYVRDVAVTEPPPVILYGISAGGTLAAAVAADGGVAGAVDVVGPTDFTRWAGAGHLYMRQIPMNSYAQKRAASPYWRLTPEASPQLIQCGVADPIVTFDQCLRYAHAARLLQPDTRLDTLIQAHAQWPRDRDAARAWITARWG